MGGFLNFVIAISFLCVVHSQLLFPGPGVTLSDVNSFEICGPVTSSITFIDPLPLGVTNALQSTILNNILDSSIHLAPDSYGNIDVMIPCTLVVETVTYSPIIDVFYPTECLPIFNMYPAPYADVTPNFCFTETYPKVFYTETLTSFAPTTLSPISSSSDIIGISEICTPNLQVVPVSYVNGLDVIPINSMPSNSVGLIDLILPPHIFGGFNDLFVSGNPYYFDNFNCY